MKYDLPFARPVLNAAGTLGFAPNPYGPIDLARLGAFITNPVSRQPRTPAAGPRLLEFSGGFLLHTGYPNPGFQAVIRQYAGRWGRAPLPVIVHLLCGEPEEVEQMVAHLEELEGVAGIELGLPPDASPQAVALFTAAAAGELPVIVRVPLEKALDLGRAALEAGAAAVSLAAARGALPFLMGALPDRENRLVRGRLYGPAVFPQALGVVSELARLGGTVIGAGGVYGTAEIEAMLAAGAAAVQLDSVLWRGFHK